MSPPLPPPQRCWQSLGVTSPTCNTWRLTTWTAKGRHFTTPLPVTSSFISSSPIWSCRLRTDDGGAASGRMVLNDTSKLLPKSISVHLGRTWTWTWYSLIFYQIHVCDNQRFQSRGYYKVHSCFGSLDRTARSCRILDRQLYTLHAKCETLIYKNTDLWNKTKNSKSPFSTQNDAFLCGICVSIIPQTIYAQDGDPDTTMR